VRLIDKQSDIDAGLAWLAKADRRLRKVIRVAGEIPLRRREPGFAGLARIVFAQQVSVASAEAIWARFAAEFPTCSPHAVHRAKDERLAATGLSRPKIKALRAVAIACRSGLDLEALGTLPAEDAHGRLTEIKGIGPWTADVYLLFCLGHPDIFPAGDLALRHAVADAFGRRTPVPIDELSAMAARWSPWRAVSARLFWSYYRVCRQRVAVPV
jgi:DNA-3-methyladenine glycosylase II